MAIAEQLTILLVAVLALGAIGVPWAAILGRRLPLDARAALAVPAGAAWVSIASVGLVLGLPIRVVGMAIIAISALTLVLVRREALACVRRAGLPLAVGTVALGFVVAPYVARGEWSATAIGADPYLWTSQARSYLDGPPPGPPPAYPDGLAQTRIETQHWATGMPMALGLSAWIGRTDPVRVFSLVASLIAVLLPLSLFVAGRACLEWPGWLAAGAATAISADSFLLFSTHYGWLPQMAGTAFALLSAVGLRLSLERPERWREPFLAGGFAAAALATYRLPFLPYLAALLGATAASYLIASPARRQALRSTVTALGRLILVAALVGMPSLIAVVRGLTRFFDTQANEATWRSRSTGVISEALGLAPRGLDSYVRGWSLLTSLAVLVLAGWSIWVLTKQRAPRADFVIGPSVAMLAVAGVLQHHAFTPYFSIKLLAYATPFFVALLLGPLAFSGWRRVEVYLLAPVATVFLATSLSMLSVDWRKFNDVESFQGLPQAAATLAPGATIRLEPRDSWNQSWAVYFLRDHPVVIDRPSNYFTGIGLDGELSPRAGRADFALSLAPARAAGKVVWRNGDLTLARVSR